MKFPLFFCNLLAIVAARGKIVELAASLAGQCCLVVRVTKRINNNYHLVGGQGKLIQKREWKLFNNFCELVDIRVVSSLSLHSISLPLPDRATKIYKVN